MIHVGVSYNSVHLQNCEKRLLGFSYLSASLSTRSNSVPTGKIFVKFWVFLSNLTTQSKFIQNMWRITGTVYGGLGNFMIMSRWILLIMRSISDKSCKGNQSTCFIFKNFFPKSCRLWDPVE